MCGVGGRGFSRRGCKLLFPENKHPPLPPPISTSAFHQQFNSFRRCSLEPFRLTAFVFFGPREIRRSGTGSTSRYALYVGARRQWLYE